MTADLAGRIALVTGSGSPTGIGFACARILARQGARLAITSTTDRIQERVATLEAAGTPAVGMAADLTDSTQADALVAQFPRAEVNALGRTVFLPPDPEPAPTGRGTILVCTAGTSDLAVAEEAAVSARALKNSVERMTDVGVAGIHRLLLQTDVLRAASVIIVVAGMEGALPSVVGGLVKVPVIAVPTSIGYGASFGGLAALLAMLNSCASGVTVVNIDNGFGAAAAASRINHS